MIMRAQGRFSKKSCVLNRQRELSWEEAGIKKQELVLCSNSTVVKGSKKRIMNTDVNQFNPECQNSTQTSPFN